MSTRPGAKVLAVWAYHIEAAVWVDHIETGLPVWVDHIEADLVFVEQRYEVLDLGHECWALG